MNKKMNWDVKHYPTYWVGDTTGEFKRTELAYPHVPKEHPKFAQSMEVGNLIFVSGCTGQDMISWTLKTLSISFQDRRFPMTRNL